jgi:hypothetical protein
MKHFKIVFAALAVLFVLTSAFTIKTTSSDFQFKSGVTYDQSHLQDRLNWEAVTTNVPQQINLLYVDWTWLHL